MFKTKTLFVLGAGASVEVGLPTGEGLKAKIATLLDFRYVMGKGYERGDQQLINLLKNIAQREGHAGSNTKWSSYQDKARQISDNMGAAISIDNYLDAHTGDDDLTLCGKLAIVKSILKAEDESNIKYSERGFGRYNRTGVTGTWYEKFFRKLTENVQTKDIATLPSSASFIIFNYDRCFEHFLAQAIEDYYAVTALVAQDLVNQFDIAHPYGTVGSLPWQQQTGAVAFGDWESANLYEQAQKIKTFTEGMTEGVELAVIRQLVAEAASVIFLGFSYQDQNLEILTPSARSHAASVMGTSLGISARDTELISTDVERLFMVEGRESVPPIMLLRETCADFFDHNWRRIGSGR